MVGRNDTITNIHFKLAHQPDSRVHNPYKYNLRGPTFQDWPVATPPQWPVHDPTSAATSGSEQRSNAAGSISEEV